MLDKSYYEKVDEIIAGYGTESRFLIPIIQDVQSEYRYLPPELLKYIADKLHITEARLIALPPSMRISPSIRRENMSSRSATVLPAMCARVPMCWRSFARYCS